MDAILLQEVSKSYGRQRGVINLNMQVKQGEIFGYLGPNGAGKTTTIRMLIGLIAPDKGSISLLGQNIRQHARELRQRIGYLPGDLRLYERMSGRDLLTFLANLRGGTDWWLADSLTQCLDADLNRPIRTLSKGNLQKLGIIQALMHRPDLLILDEPTSGLDPLIQNEFHCILTRSRSEKQTVFFSSHNLAEVEQICDRVAIIRDGSLMTTEHIYRLRSKSLRKLTLVFSEEVPSEAFVSLPGVSDVQVEGNILRCTAQGSIDALIKEAARYPLEDIHSEKAGLEEIFLRFYQGGQPR